MTEFAVERLYGRVVFREGATEPYFVPSKREIVLPAGVKIDRTGLRHEMAHSIYHSLPEDDRKKLTEAFEREIGYADYMHIIRANGGRVGHPEEYYLKSDGQQNNDRIVNEWCATLAEHPEFYRNVFDFAPNFKHVFEEIGFNKPARTLRKLKKPQFGVK